MIKKYIFGIQLAFSHIVANEKRIGFPHFSIFGQNRSKGEQVMAINCGGDSVKCYHLRGKKIQTCNASRQLYVPSLFELEEYCNTTKSARCPLLIMRTRGDQYTAQGERKSWVLA
jgi:hypothetical protein